MKKNAKIKINQTLDEIRIDVDQHGTNNWGTVCTWRTGVYTLDQKEAILEVAKAKLFDETWKLTEMGYDVKVIPYIN